MHRNSCADPAKLLRVAEHAGTGTDWAEPPCSDRGTAPRPRGCPQPAHPAWMCTPDTIPGAARLPWKVNPTTHWTHLLCCLNKLSCLQPFCTQFQITTTGKPLPIGVILHILQSIATQNYLPDFKISSSFKFWKKKYFYFLTLFNLLKLCQVFIVIQSTAQKQIICGHFDH